MTEEECIKYIKHKGFTFGWGGEVLDFKINTISEYTDGDYGVCLKVVCGYIENGRTMTKTLYFDIGTFIQWKRDDKIDDIIKDANT